MKSVKTNMPKSIYPKSSLQTKPKPAPPGSLSVPAAAWDLNPGEFPSSVRLQGVFRKKNIRRLGDLHGLALSDLRQLGNCGPTTIKELVRLLKRIAAGEFILPQDGLSPANLAGLLRKLDDTIADLSARERDVILLRLGAAKGGQFWTLKKIGNKFHLTRERVRQIMELLLPLVRKAGGPGLAAQLRAIAAACARTVCPLTPALLEQWLAGVKNRGRYALPFYVRLLGEMHPEIPAWPVGQEHRTDPRPGRQEEALKALKNLLQEGEWRLPVKTAFKLVSAQAGLRDLRVAEFLEALKYARSLKVEFEKPDQPKVRLRWLAANLAVTAVLETSDRPLRVPEISERLHAVFGPEMGDWSLGSVRRALNLECYCLKRGLFGLRKHFRLPEPLRRKACSDVHELLKKQDHPISPFRIVNEGQFPWAAKTTGFELVELLREDGRFAEVRRFHFDLASRAPAEQRAG
jgi:hypothetical protein